MSTGSERRRTGAICAALTAASLAWPAGAEPPDRTEVAAAIERSAGYLIRNQEESGRFTYLRRLDDEPVSDSTYNLLRHAGTMYSLERYHDRTGDERVLPVLERAADELRTFVAPVENAPWTSALWSDPTRLGGDPDQPPYAKLGGAGLSLVALSWLEAHRPARAPDAASLEQIRALGRFVVFMQRGDGGFHSRFRPGSGFDESWHSLYYTGEALLGLLALHAVDPNPTWLHASERALLFLAESRADDGDRVPPDHWILVATARYLEVANPPVPFRTALLRHAEQVSRSLLRESGDPDDRLLAGALNACGEVPATATRLEGLFAALRIFSGDRGPTRQQVRAATDAGIAFLLRVQVREGPMAGAFPRMPRATASPRSAEQEEQNRRASEVRVDYVQHAMTALIDYLESDRGLDLSLHEESGYRY